MTPTVESRAFHTTAFSKLAVVAPISIIANPVTPFGGCFPRSMLCALSFVRQANSDRKNETVASQHLWSREEFSRLSLGLYPENQDWASNPNARTGTVARGVSAPDGLARNGAETNCGCLLPPPDPSWKNYRSTHSLDQEATICMFMEKPFRVLTVPVRFLCE